MNRGNETTNLVLRLPLHWVTRSHRLIQIQLYVNIAQYKQLFPKYWTLTVAYGCVTFIAGFENIPAVRRPSSRRKAQQNMQASLSLVEWCHVTA